MPEDGLLAAVAHALSVPVEQLRQAQHRLVHVATPGEGYTTAIPDHGHMIPCRLSPSSTRMHVLDLFCGIGGFSHGFELSGAFQVVAGLDLLSDRISTFSQNHPHANAVCADIRTVSVDSLIDEGPTPEVVIGGPPCQGFSSIRPFRNLTDGDPRNSLFEYFGLVVRKVRPKWFVLENVVGLLTHKKGQTLHDIIRLFEEIGYKTSWKVLNAAMYGLPQRRERLVVVGNRQGVEFCWPSPTHFLDARSMAGKFGQTIEQLPLFGKSLRPAVTVMEAIHDLPSIRAGESADKYRDDIIPTEYEKMLRGGCSLLTLHEATAHTDRMLEIIRKAGHNRYALPDGLTLSGFSSCYSRLEPDKPSVTVTVNFVHPASNRCIHPFQDRALTPREGARLQGIEDDFKFEGTRSQIVKQIGNAVPPLLGRVIAEALARQI